MKPIAEPGDVFIKRVEIINPKLNISVNPLDQLLGIDIYEDMTKPTLYATFTFNDNINLLTKFPIIGEEQFVVEIQSPGISKPTVFKFRSFEVSGVVRDANGKGTTYTVRCVSEEHLRSGSQLISQSMTDIISNMVPVVVSTYLKSTKEFIFDETKGIQTIAFPKMNPLQAIDMLRQRAVSKEYAGSAYVFFENQSGFNFKCVEGLIKSGKQGIGSRVFNAQDNTMATKESQANAYRTILDYTNLTKADGNRKAALGAFKAITKTFDIQTKEFGTQSFDVQNIFSKLQTPGTKVQPPNTDDWIKEFGSGSPKQFFTPKDTTRPDNFIDSVMAARNSYAVLLNSDMTRVLIHGDTGLKVGDMVQLNLPEPVGTTGARKKDSMTAGNYLIIRLRHMITPSTKSKHQIVFDCVKMGI